MDCKVVAVIGLGYSGIHAINTLLSHAANEVNAGRIKILGVEVADLTKSGGIAWRPDCQHLLSNMPVGAMKVAEHGIGTFEDWLIRNAVTLGVDLENLSAQFVPRDWFGQYLGAVLDDSLARFGDKTVRLIKGEVHTVKRSNGRYELGISSSKTQVTELCDAVLLCTGAPQRSSLGRALDAAKSLWPLQRLFGIPSTARVAIIGSGLSAVDAARFLLKERNHAGSIFIVSRSAGSVLPGVVHAAETPCGEAKFFTRDRVKHCQSLSQLLEMARQELGLDSWDKFSDRSEALEVQRLRHRIQRAASGAPAPVYLARVRAIEALFADVFAELPTTEKLAWLQHPLRRLFQSVTNPMPLQSATALLDWLDSGRLVLQGGCTGLEELADSTVKVTCDGNSFVVDAAVDATGVGFDVGQGSALSLNMVETGLVQKDVAGGVVVNPESLRCVGSECDRLYVAGGLARGACYLTSGLSFSRRMVDTAVECLYENL